MRLVRDATGPSDSQADCPTSHCSDSRSPVFPLEHATRLTTRKGVVESQSPVGRLTDEGPSTDGELLLTEEESNVVEFLTENSDSQVASSLIPAVVNVIYQRHDHPHSTTGRTSLGNSISGDPVTEHNPSPFPAAWSRENNAEVRLFVLRHMLA